MAMGGRIGVQGGGQSKMEKLYLRKVPFKLTKIIWQV